jgi:hypothetical protein
MAANRRVIGNGETGSSVRSKINDNFHDVYSFTTGTTATTLTNLNLKANKAFSINTQTGSTYTLVLTDADSKLIDINKATPVIVTIPLNSSVSFTIGTTITFKRSGNGLMTFTGATTGVTITASAGVLTDPGKNLYVTLIKTGTNSWDLQNGGNGSYITFTPGFTGFSVNPTSVDATYYQNGKFVHIQIFMAAGTSNATTFSITGLPVAPRKAVNALSLIMNAGTTSAGRVDIAAGATTANMSTAAGTAFTASGNKACWMNISYEAQ